MIKNILILGFEFAQRLLRVLYPTLWIIIPFIWLGRRILTRGAALRFFIIFLFIELGGRFAAYLSGIPYQYRYLYPFVVAVIVLSGAGIEEFVNRAVEILKRFSWYDPERITPKHVLIVAIAGILVASIPKALRTHSDKTYIREIPKTIVNRCPAGRKPVLISGLDEMRLGYYCGGEYLELKRRVNLLKKTVITVTAENKEPVVLTNAKRNPDLDHALVLPVPSLTRFQVSFEFPAKKLCPRRIGFLDLFPLGCGQGRLTVEALKGDVLKSTSGKGELPDEKWHILYQGPLQQQTKLFKIKYLKNLKLTFELEKPVTQLAVSLTRYPAWTLLRKNTGFNSEEWFPVNERSGFEQLSHDLKMLGGNNVFLLLPGKGDQWINLFRTRACQVNLHKIQDYDLEKRGPFTLLQFSSESPASADE